VKVIMNLAGLGFPDHFTENILGSIFLVASVLLFIVILLTINRLRHKFSATTCFELGVVLFLFSVTANSQIRSLIFQNLIQPILNWLLTPLRRLLESLLGSSF
jgi:hypothetical protein